MATKEEKDKNIVDENPTTNQAEVVDQATENTSESPEEMQEELLEEGPMIPQSKFDELNEKYLRLYSDFENFRKRTQKEKADIILSASSRLMKEVLPVVDDLERAIEANTTSADIVAVKEGVTLIATKLTNILTSNGLTPMESKGKEFNTDWHEALTNIPAPTKKLKGKVVDVVEKGYLMNDKVIRFAKVVVGQ
ncbi:MAG: molecular chaperone GrpE [Sphingobacteriales bacterium]|jgi:molecular chaperone GrpE